MGFLVLVELQLALKMNVRHVARWVPILVGGVVLVLIVGLRFLSSRPPTDGDHGLELQEQPGPALWPLASSQSETSFLPLPTTPSADAAPEGTAPRAFALPIELVLRPFMAHRHLPELQPFLEHLSNVSQAVNHILLSGKYRLHHFGRSSLNLARDEHGATDWQLLPNPTNLTIVAVTAKVYRDSAFTVLDPSRSFLLQCDPANGHLRSFEWNDVHERVEVETDGTVIYGLNLSNLVYRQLQWDAAGELISSNIYDWAKRGRIIPRAPTPQP